MRSMQMPVILGRDSIRMRDLRRTLLCVCCAWLASACELPPTLNPQIAALCRDHSNQVLVFDWQGERRVLPLDSGMTLQQDAQWRARLALPARSTWHNNPDKLSHLIRAVRQFGDGW